MSTFAKFEAIPVHALVRRENVKKMVKALKLFIYLVIVVILVFALSQVINAYLGTSTTLDRLNNDIAKFTSKVEQDTNINVASRNYSSIASKNIFAIEQPKSIVKPTPIPKKSDAGLTLIGTYVSKGEPSQAIIEHTKKRTQEVFEKNDKIFDEGKVLAIYTDRVEIERNGKTEVLTLDDSAASLSSGSSDSDQQEIVVDETELNKALDDLPLLLTQARAVPYFKDGKAVGLRLFAIRNGSLYQKVGLKNGDILKSINGNSLGDISQAMKLFEKLKEERSIALVVERNRKEQTFRYSIQ